MFNITKIHTWLFLVTFNVVFLLFFVFTGKSVEAAGVVTDCSKFGPGTGTLQATLSGGGLVQFSCSGTITPGTGIVINNSTILDATGFEIVLDGTSLSSPVFSVTQGVTLTLKNITIQNGATPDNGAALYTIGGNLEVLSSTLRASTAGGLGGAIFSKNGRLTIRDSSILNNSALQGGAIYLENSFYTVTNSQLNFNQTGSAGGAIAAVSNSMGAISATHILSNTVNGVNGQGGAVFNSNGALTVTDSEFGYHRAFSQGGAVYNITGTVTIRNSRIMSNTFIGSGGGVYNLNGSLNISRTTFTGNEANDEGGAIAGNGGFYTLYDSTFTGNSARAGGALSTNAGQFGSGVKIANSTFADNRSQFTPEEGGGASRNNGATITAVSSTFYDNRADYKGGAIFNKSGVITLANATISTNRANNLFAVGGVYNAQGSVSLINSTVYLNQNFATTALLNFNSGATTFVTNTIIATTANAEGTLCSGTITNGGNNLQFPGTSCGAAIPVADPKLAPLADNGGLVRTHALLTGSPALGTGAIEVCTDVIVDNKDARGATRSITDNAFCDIGAFESVPASLQKAFTPSAIAPGGTSVLRFTLTNESQSALSNLRFVDNFPPQIQVATTPGVATTCSGGTITAPSSATVISVTGVTLAPRAMCVISLTITSNQPGVWENITEPLFANETGAGPTSNRAKLAVGGACTNAATLVNSVEDGTPGGCVITLRQAVLNAGANGTVGFSSEILSGTLPLALNAPLTVPSGVQILTPDCSSRVAITASGSGPVLTLQGGNILRGLSITAASGPVLVTSSIGNTMGCNLLKIIHHK
jgi:hypothetical protein